jgi:hypothetical protein
MDVRMDRALEANGVASAMMGEHQKQTAFPLNISTDLATEHSTPL